MNPVLRALLDHHDGVLSRTEVTEVLPQWTIDSACRRSLLRRVLPEVYVDPALLTDKAATPVDKAATPVDEAHRHTGGDPFTRLDARRARRAVLAYVAGRGAFSHLTALELWGLRRQPQAEPLHLTVPAESKLVSRPGLIIHHVIGFTVAPPQVLTRAGTPMTRLERALVDSWPILTTGDRRAPMIHAVTGRRTTPERIAEALARVPKLPGRACLLSRRLRRAGKGRLRAGRVHHTRRLAPVGNRSAA